MILYISPVLFQSVKTIHINDDSLHSSKNASIIQNQPYQIENKSKNTVINGIFLEENY